MNEHIEAYHIRQTCLDVLLNFAVENREPAERTTIATVSNLLNAKTVVEKTRSTLIGGAGKRRATKNSSKTIEGSIFGR